MLKAPKLGSLGVGTPVYYRRLKAGQVVAYDLARDGQSVDVKIFVNAPYDKYVNTEHALLERERHRRLARRRRRRGAHRIAGRADRGRRRLRHARPSRGQPEPAAANAVFTLYADRTTAMKQPDPIARRYVLYFNESLRGLSVGAPVTLFGLPAGEVTEVGLDLDPATAVLADARRSWSIPSASLRRLGRRASAVGAAAQGRRTRSASGSCRRLVEEQGLRAQLRSGSLLTGQLFVAFDYFPDAPKAKIDWTRTAPELPVVPEHHSRARGEAQQHPHQARQAAARRDRRAT